MRPSPFLTALALVGNFASGFSSAPKPLAMLSRPQPLNLQTTTSSSPTSSSTNIMFTHISRGGAIKATAASDDTPHKAFRFVASLWGTTGVVYILAKAIRRVLPIALEPYLETSTPLTHFQLAAYVLTSVWFAYVEGYKGFQTKFAPLVVARSQTIEKWYHVLLAPFYSMGLFHATKKRLIVSWSVTLGVAGIVAVVKKLPYPWRNIVDAGVVAGLLWGSVSILVIWCKSLYQGKSPDIDPALPNKDKAE